MLLLRAPDSTGSSRLNDGFSERPARQSRLDITGGRRQRWPSTGSLEEGEEEPRGLWTGEAEAAQGGDGGPCLHTGDVGARELVEGLGGSLRVREIHAGGLGIRPQGAGRRLSSAAKYVPASWKLRPIDSSVFHGFPWLDMLPESFFLLDRVLVFETTHSFLVPKPPNLDRV